MTALDQPLPSSLLRHEWLLVCIAAWLAFASIPVTRGEIGISWDMLNHHVYLGWTAEHARFGHDLSGAGSQSYQFPYLYWPVYKLATSGWSGQWAGATLATLCVPAVPAVWLLARLCMPGPTAFDAVMRLLAVVLAFLSVVVLAAFDTTSNDLMASIPLLWALALALQPASAAAPPANARTLVMLSGLCAGLSVACKLSNGPLAILLPALWVFSARGARGRLVNVAVGCGATAVGFMAAYGYWGALLWHHFGNPVYPFYDELFAPLRMRLGWTP
ncbi:hypothetical protein LZ009_18370 [Ramlibacter sp. XY19]|uniref:hypothetical protein n=1 Tax=Ramlibacter paludis TaxID=2908000 RepID=UPI0023DCD8B4|nr:hypothetical protein [Ramlibacter paludis]MCG2594749.1 hypothetical protein [Ramlibacter paludis]